MTQLASDHSNELREEEANLVGIGTVPGFAIGQRALLVQAKQGNVLWDCVSLLDGPTAEALEGLGGIKAICCSHPHFYAAAVSWAERFGAPFFVPEADRRWLMRPSPEVQIWSGESFEPVPGVTVAKIGGHFDGAAVLHWPEGAEGHGALLTGDTVMVAKDRRWVSFMWSYPNLVPLSAGTVQDIAERVGRFSFEKIYGGWWGNTVFADGAAAVRRSAERYIEFIKEANKD